MHKIAKLIVDSRKLIMIIFLAAALLSVYTSTLTVVEDDLNRFLPEDTETRQGLAAMEGEFITYATAKVMVRDISLDDAGRLAQDIQATDGIKSVTFDDTEHHYKDGCALFDVTFAGGVDDEISAEALAALRELVSGAGDTEIYTEVGMDLTKDIVNDMIYVGILVVIIVTALLLLTSRSYAEVPVLVITFVAAAVLQLGTNFIFESISFVSNAVTLILQLALAIDYAVILCNRFAEEKQHLGQYDAMVEALAKAIPEISSSSLTTIGGLIAMTFMQFGLGGDLGKVLIKSIIFSMLSVFLLMPGLLMVFGKAIEKTKHRSFIPRIDAVGRFAWKTRKILPPVFICIALVSLYFANRIPLSYNYRDAYPVRLNDSQVSRIQIVETFGESNTMALVVPSGDYETEAKMLDEIAAKEHVTSVLGIASVEAIDGYRLGDKLTIGEFSELAGLDNVTASALFAYYAARNSDYDLVEGDLRQYKIPLIDLFMFLYDTAESGDIELDKDKLDMIEELYAQLTDAKAQLQGRHYSRMLIYCDTAVQSDESYALIEEIHAIARSYYGDDVYVTGDATASRDLDMFFSQDSLMVSVLSALFVVAIIIFTFRSFGLAVLLIAVIQGSIWLNFSIPYFTGDPIFFVGYLIVSAIQMGANIDYAIVVSNRYLTLRGQRFSRRKAVTGALNGALPTLITSGSILAIAGLLIGLLTSEATTSGIGIALGRGTFISLLMVLFVLPQMLIWGDKFIRKTRFSRKRHLRVPPRFAGDFEAVAREQKSQQSE